MALQVVERDEPGVAGVGDVEYVAVGILYGPCRGPRDDVAARLCSCIGRCIRRASGRDSGARGRAVGQREY